MGQIFKTIDEWVDAFDAAPRQLRGKEAIDQIEGVIGLLTEVAHLHHVVTEDPEDFEEDSPEEAEIVWIYRTKSGDGRTMWAAIASAGNMQASDNTDGAGPFFDIASLTSYLVERALPWEEWALVIEDEDAETLAIKNALLSPEAGIADRECV